MTKQTIIVPSKASEKQPSLRDQVIARLKAVNCYPSPPQVIDYLTAKVQDKVSKKTASVVEETIKGMGSVASAMSELEKTNQSQQP